MSKNGCDYYHAVNPQDKINCPNCIHWSGTRCLVEYRFNNKTELVHEPFRVGGKQHVRGLWY
jgi:hypothetical protein